MKINKQLAMMAISGLIASSSFAGVSLTTNLATFQGAGTSSVVSTFEEFPSNGFSYPSNPYLQGGVSYSNTSNLIVNNGTSYITNGTNMMVNDWWNPNKGTFYQNFSLFGFDAGWTNADDNGTVITIGTNLGNYVFNVDFNVASSADFYGFVADVNEFFTSFSISSNNNNALDGIDNVRVGGAGGSSVPEPTSLTLIALGLAGFGAMRRKQKAA